MTQHDLHRREVLRAIGVGGTMTALAGCSSGDGEDEEESTAQAEEGTDSEGQSSEDDSGQYDGEYGAPPVEIHVNFYGSWSGSVGTESAQTSVEGYGQRRMTIDGYPEVVSATIQKEEDGPGELLVEISVDGTTVASQATTASYGVVSLSVRP